MKDHSVNERGNLLLTRCGLLFLSSSKGSFIYTIPHTGQYIPAFSTPAVELYLQHTQIALRLNNCASIYFKTDIINKYLFTDLAMYMLC